MILLRVLSRLRLVLLCEWTFDRCDDFGIDEIDDDVWTFMIARGAYKDFE